MSAALKIRGVRSVAVEVPMKLPLGTSAQKIDRATLLLIDLDTDEGVTGRSYVFCVLKAVAAPVANKHGQAAIRPRKEITVIAAGDVSRAIGENDPITRDQWCGLGH